MARAQKVLDEAERRLAAAAEAAGLPTEQPHAPSQPRAKKRNHLGLVIGGGSGKKPSAPAAGEETREQRCVRVCRLLEQAGEQELDALLKAEPESVPPEWRERYEAAAGEYWDIFYSQKGSGFFKERHYIRREYPALLEDTGVRRVLVEMGCGPGANVFSLLRECKDLFVVGYDFSATAVGMMKAHPDYDPSRVAGHVKDITCEPLSEVAEACPDGADCVSMFFVLSAISPEKMPGVVQRAFECLRKGGRVLFRDYAVRDLSQLRFASGHKLSDNFYVRGDGTRTYYFDHLFVHKLFTEAGFVAHQSIQYVKKTITNRKRKVNMTRVWIQGLFEKPDPAAPAPAPGEARYTTHEEGSDEEADEHAGSELEPEEGPEGLNEAPELHVEGPEISAAPAERL